MIEGATSRGGPSATHEDRASTLAAMATLAQYAICIDALPDGSRPDVLQVRSRDYSIFVGDAKATETPGNVETALRLARYTNFLARYRSAGGSGVMALAVSPVDRYDWLRVLRDVCRSLADGRIAGNVDVIDDGCAIVWQAFVPVSKLVRPPQGRVWRVVAEGLNEVRLVAES